MTTALLQRVAMLRKLARLKGWKRIAMTILLGALSAFAYPPFNIIISPFIAFPLWLYILSLAENEGGGRHFALGWSFGFGYFTVNLYWITFSLGVDLSIFWW